MTGEQSMVGQARRRAHCMSSLRSAVATFALFAMTAINAPSVRAADLAISELERAPAYDDTCLKTTITHSETSLMSGGSYLRAFQRINSDIASQNYLTHCSSRPRPAGVLVNPNRS